MNNNVHISGNYGPAVPAGWSVVGVADFNGDGHPDYLLFNEATRDTVIWYMNNNVHISGNYGPAVPTGWSVVGAGRFRRQRQTRLSAVQFEHSPNSDLLHE